MKIDARDTALTDLLRQLKELTSPGCTCEDGIEVLVGARKDAKKVKAFASMSGFKAALYHEGGHYGVRISGSSCGCFR